MKNFVLAAACLCLTACLGYHIGPVKPYYLRDVHTIAVPTFENKTLIPRIEALTTDTVIKQFQQDGTFQIASSQNADATLKGEISRITRSPARSLAANVLVTTEFNLVLTLKYKLVGHDGKVIGSPGEVTGSTSFFVEATAVNGSPQTGDVTADERQALPLAAEELANHLVSQLSEGW